MISIITISLNQGHYLPMAVESVLLQEGVEIEHIIVDAGSTDGSREYLRSLRDPRVRLILEPDDGPPDGLNKGFRLSRGDILGYLNADDVYVAGALAEAHDLLVGDPKLDVVYGDGWLIDGGSSVIRHFDSSRWSLRAFGLDGVSLLQQATFFRRRSFEATNGFNANNATWWDAQLLIDMALTGASIRHVARDWGMFRLHEGGMSGSGRAEAQYRVDRDSLARAALRGRAVIGSLRAGRLLARGWKWLANPGYVVQRLRASALAGAPVIRTDGGFSVARVGRAAGAPGGVLRGRSVRGTEDCE